MLRHGFDVGFVTVGAYHDDACSELRVDHFISDYFDCPVGGGNGDAFAYKPCVAFIARVDCHGNAGGDQLGSCRGYGQVTFAREGEVDVVECTLTRLVVHFSVSDGGFASGTPVNGVGTLVDEPFLVELDEAQLGSPPVVWIHGLVLGGPVVAATELLDGGLHDVDVLVHELLA